MEALKVQTQGFTKRQNQWTLGLKANSTRALILEVLESITSENTSHFGNYSRVLLQVPISSTRLYDTTARDMTNVGNKSPFPSTKELKMFLCLVTRSRYLQWNSCTLATGVNVGILFNTHVSASCHWRKWTDTSRRCWRNTVYWCFSKVHEKQTNLWITFIQRHFPLLGCIAIRQPSICPSLNRCRATMGP